MAGEIEVAAIACRVIKAAVHSSWTGEGIHLMIPVQVCELKEIDGNLDEVLY